MGLACGTFWIDRVDCGVYAAHGADRLTSTVFCGREASAHLECSVCLSIAIAHTECSWLSNLRGTPGQRKLAAEGHGGGAASGP